MTKKYKPTTIETQENGLKLIRYERKWSNLKTIISSFDHDQSVPILYSTI